MIRSILVAFVAIAALGVSAKSEESSSGRPTLKSEAIVSGDIVRIGDLIENAGIVASVPIFRSPDLGYTGTISADAVLEAVRSHALIGVATGGIRDVVVTRASRTIPAKDVEDVIARALSARFDLGPTKDIVVSFTRDMQTMHVEPSSQGVPRVAHIDFDARSGRFDAMLEIPAGAAKRTAMRLSGRAVATVEVATVTRTIERGGVLRDSDVLMDRRPRAEIGRDVITRREQAISFAARNSLQPGRPLRLVDLTKPDLVQRNETVTLVYEVPGIVLTVRGKAADGGAEGDTISVLNEQSKRTVQGTIIGPGRVLVSNGSRRLASNNASRENADAAAR
ncbi:MAG: flagellar basal body P-ring formation chaperone FlgA [Pseudolabrys sp.]